MESNAKKIYVSPSNEVLIDLTRTICPIPDHQENHILGVCIDKNCTSPEKFVCNECIFDLHNGHQLVKIRVINEILNKEQLQSKALSDSSLAELMKEMEKTVIEEMENIRNKTIDLLKKNATEFLNQVHRSVLEKCKAKKGSNSLQLLSYKEIKDFTSEERSELFDLIKGKINKTNENLEEKEDLIGELKQSNSKLQAYFKTLNESSELFLLEKLKDFKPETFLPLGFKSEIEWCQKTFSEYAFYYDLSNNNKSGIKMRNGGTITILRSKDPLIMGFIHSIEVLISYKSNADYDIGFGPNSLGTSCWIRGAGGYGITNVGIFENSIKKNDIALKDLDRIRFEIVFKEKESSCKISINDNFIHTFAFELVEVYLMAAMRGVNDSVTITEYRRNPI